MTSQTSCKPVITTSYKYKAIPEQYLSEYPLPDIKKGATAKDLVNAYLDLKESVKSCNLDKRALRK
jgi:hypothetical protein